MYSVYEITNSANGKKYIGITSRDIVERFMEHLSRAKNNTRNGRLYSAMRKYGEDCFSVELLEQTDKEEIVRKLETDYIEKNNSYNNGYNCNLGGRGVLEFSAETRQKMSTASLEKKMSASACEKMSKSKTDNPLPRNLGDYTLSGGESPRSKCYKIKHPSGKEEIVRGAREFCRKYGIHLQSLNRGYKSKGFVLLERFNDYPEREYTQASGSAHLPTG
jgi:group I intron endonuclease